MTLFMRRCRSVRERSLVFHAYIFCYTFSTRGSNASALDLSRCTSKPKYFPKGVPYCHHEDGLQHGTVVLLCIGESIMNDLCMLMSLPDVTKNS